MLSYADYYGNSMGSLLAPQSQQIPQMPYQRFANSYGGGPTTNMNHSRAMMGYASQYGAQLQSPLGWWRRSVGPGMGNAQRPERSSQYPWWIPQPSAQQQPFPQMSLY